MIGIPGRSSSLRFVIPKWLINTLRLNSQDFLNPFVFNMNQNILVPERQ